MGDDAVLGIILPFYRFLLRERVSHVHQICSGSDFTLRQSLYIFVKFYLLKLRVIVWAEIMSEGGKKERFVSKVFHFCSALGGLHHSI